MIGLGVVTLMSGCTTYVPTQTTYVPYNTGVHYLTGAAGDCTYDDNGNVVYHFNNGLIVRGRNNLNTMTFYGWDQYGRPHYLVAGYGWYY